MVRFLRRWWRKHRLHYALFKLREGDGTRSRYEQVRLANELLVEVNADLITREQCKRVHVTSYLADVCTLLALVRELQNRWDSEGRLYHRQNLVAPVAGDPDAHSWLWAPVHRDRQTLPQFQGALFSATQRLLESLEPLAEDQPRYVDRHLKYVEDGYRSLVELLVTLEDTF